MKHLFLILTLFTSLTAYCQDVLVTNDGESLKVYNMEIGPSAIFYQLSDEANAEIKRIAKTDVLIIRKADGTKIDPNAVTVSQSTGFNSNANASLVNPKLVEENLALVKEFNNHDVIYLNDDTDKKASTLICALGIKDGSVIETPEIEANFSMKIKYVNVVKKTSRIAEITDKSKANEDGEYYMIVVTLRNKSDKTIYIDLGTSYVIAGGEATPYYMPMATTTSTGTSSGSSVNMGAVAGALGVSGALGTIAGGVNLGGGTSTSTSTTTYSQRVISIPPMASVSLSPQSIGQGRTSSYPAVPYDVFDCIVLSCYDYFNNQGCVFNEKKHDEIRFEELKRGDRIEIPQMEGVSPLSVHISYSFDELLSQPLNMRIDFYWRQILGIHWDIPYSKQYIDYSKCPLIFAIGNPIKVNYR